MYTDFHNTILEVVQTSQRTHSWVSIPKYLDRHKRLHPRPCTAACDELVTVGFLRVQNGVFVQITPEGKDQIERWRQRQSDRRKREAAARGGPKPKSDRELMEEADAAAAKAEAEAMARNVEGDEPETSFRDATAEPAATDDFKEITTAPAEDDLVQDPPSDPDLVPGSDDETEGHGAGYTGPEQSADPSDAAATAAAAKELGVSSGEVRTYDRKGNSPTRRGRR